MWRRCTALPGLLGVLALHACSGAYGKVKEMTSDTIRGDSIRVIVVIAGESESADRQMAGRVRATLDPVIVLPGPYYMTDFTVGSVSGFGNGSLELLERFNEGIAQVAKEQDCLYVNLLDAYLGTDWMIHYDGVHANDLGHRIVANRIFEVLAQNCSALAAKTKKAELTSPRWRDESTLMS